MEQILTELELPLYRFMLRLCHDQDLAADLTQETMLRAWKNRLRLKEPRAIRVWLFRIGVNVWKDRCRSWNPDPLSGVEIEQPSREPNPAELVAAKELGQAVWEAIDRLPERQKQVMHLRVLELMEPSEIAETLGLDVRRVRSNLSAARQKLRQQFAHRGIASARQENGS